MCNHTKRRFRSFARKVLEKEVPERRVLRHENMCFSRHEMRTSIGVNDVEKSCRTRSFKAGIDYSPRKVVHRLGPCVPNDAPVVSTTLHYRSSSYRATLLRTVASAMSIPPHGALVS